MACNKHVIAHAFCHGVTIGSEDQSVEIFKTKDCEWFVKLFVNLQYCLKIKMKGFKDGQYMIVSSVHTLERERVWGFKE